MTFQRLREVHRAHPFRPFIMHLADGKALRVSHPESLAYNPTGRIVVYVASKGETHYVDLLLVARIEVSNGAQRRKASR